MTRENPEALDALTPVVEAFERLGIRYHVGGSIASSVYGTPRATADVDIVADLRHEQVGELAEKFRGSYYIDASSVHDAISRRQSFNLIHLDTMVKVDVFVPQARPFDEQELVRAVPHALDVAEGARRFYVKSPEDLVLRKLEWYRQGGEVSERQWNDVVGVLRVQTGRLDEDYLARWGEALGLTDLLKRARDQATR